MPGRPGEHAKKRKCSHTPINRKDKNINKSQRWDFCTSRDNDIFVDFWTCFSIPLLSGSRNKRCVCFFFRCSPINSSPGIIYWMNCTATFSVAILVFYEGLLLLWRSTQKSWKLQTTSWTDKLVFAVTITTKAPSPRGQSVNQGFSRGPKFPLQRKTEAKQSRPQAIGAGTPLKLDSIAAGGLTGCSNTDRTCQTSGVQSISVACRKPTTSRRKA